MGRLSVGSGPVPNTSRLLARLDELVGLGNLVLATATGGTVNEEYSARWHAGVTAFFVRVFGADHTYTARFLKATGGEFLTNARSGHGIVQAARDDVAAGGLVSLENFVAAGVLSDFLDMAEYLAESDYYHPAASLGGAVLEQGLRRMCETNDIALKPRDSISSLNQKLADAKVYPRLRQKTIEAWNQIRNHVDHGEFDQVTRGDVEPMVAGIRDFLGSVLD